MGSIKSYYHGCCLKLKSIIVGSKLLASWANLLLQAFGRVHSGQKIICTNLVWHTTDNSSNSTITIQRTQYQLVYEYLFTVVVCVSL